MIGQVSRCEPHRFRPAEEDELSGFKGENGFCALARQCSLSTASYPARLDAVRDLCSRDSSNHTGEGGPHCAPLLPYHYTANSSSGLQSKRAGIAPQPGKPVVDTDPGSAPAAMPHLRGSSNFSRAVFLYLLVRRINSSPCVIISQGKWLARQSTGRATYIPFTSAAGMSTPAISRPLGKKHVSFSMGLLVVYLK